MLSEQLEKIYELKEKGALTEEEYKIAKEKILEMIEEEKKEKKGDKKQLLLD